MIKSNFAVKFLLNLSLIIVTLLSLIYCTKKVADPRATLLKIDSYNITQEQVDYRNQVIKIYYPQESRDLGLEQLKKYYQYLVILKKHGRVLNNEVLELEAARIDKETKDQQTLDQIKKVFGSDREAYLYTYVMPILVEREIYFGLYLKDPKLQKTDFSSWVSEQIKAYNLQ